jgi:hypothetical protein
LIKDNYHSDIYTGVIPAVNAADQYAELGPGTSMEACRKLATDQGWKAYGHRKSNHSNLANTCWAIKDVGIVSKNLLDDSTRQEHAIGCTDIGRSIDDNCGYDVKRGHHVIGSTYVELGAGNSMDDCRKLAESHSSSPKAFGHRSKDHPVHANTCWGITGDVVSTNIEATANHSVGCTKVGKTLDGGCI